MIRGNNTIAPPENKQIQKLILDTLPIRVFWKDTSSNYLGCNMNFAHDCDVSSPDQVVGRNDFDFFEQKIAEAFRKDDAQVMETGKPKVRFEEPQANPGGEQRWLETSKIPLRDDEGNIIGILGTYHDITDRVRLQKQRAETEKLRALNDQLSAFLANTSHEIRTPLNGIIGMAQLLGKADLSPSHADHVNTIIDSGKVLMVILNDILDLSKIDANMLELSPTKGNLLDTVKRATALFIPAAKDKGIKLALSVGSPPPEALIFDATRVKQIISNLVSNAIKFTESGSVRLSVHCEADERSDYQITIKVRDTGIGMEKAEINRLFQPFMQADHSTTRLYGGTGLGLAISQKLARLMNGDIIAASAPNKGSLFTLKFPAQSAKEQALPLSEDPGNTAYSGVVALPQKRILLVDDSVVNRKVARLFLQPLQCEIVEADNGAKALELLDTTAEQFDLILLDLRMPIMDGPATIKHIRQSNKPYQNIPVIALTADALGKSKALCSALGMDGYITKPIDEREFLTQIIKLIGADNTKPKAVA